MAEVPVNAPANIAGISSTTADKIIAFIQQQIGAVVSGFHEYGPSAVHAIGSVKQMEAISHLFCNFLMMLLFGALIAVCYKGWCKISEKSKENYKNNIAWDEDGVLVLRFLITTIITLTIAITFSNFIGDMYYSHTMYIVDAVSPDIAFTHFIMEKVGSAISAK